ncbi:hypothetical protein QSH57_005063 [Fusarium oxysporum f. sp. vasinfectum]|nr:hypothetical protein QSH57_005063 [Fusarium oxysporum f. sp. vasinfectum]
MSVQDITRDEKDSEERTPSPARAASNARSDIFSAPSFTATPLNQDSLADLELLEYWHRRPFPTNASGPGRRLEYDPIRLGFSHHYLLNSILALAALQLFDEDRSQIRWYVRAVAHRQAAITRVTPHLERMEESQHLALLSFSFFTSLYTVAEPLLRPGPFGCHQPDFDPVKELLQAIRIGRCATVFAQQHLGPVISSDPSFVVKYHPRRLEAIQGLESRFPQLAWLRGFIERQCGDQERAVCLHATESLFASIALAVDSLDDSRQIQAIWGWASTIDSTFLDMCSAQNTRYLVFEELAGGAPGTDPSTSKCRIGGYYMVAVA